ncbi:serine/threonine protein phosphatase [Hoylesella buccalis]|uniref:Serine/threonine protein phosphatase n=1 Tax=Hoylesella buccalis TaxID=28127 RepID=A0A2N6QQM1_9BACT|nr:metallophosphoesterase [Hoylesella buccalis]PMC24039.1 serine/threonine protein phosphatase [Hoylesella buccalis]
MIARIFIFLLFLIILPDVYLDLHYLRKKKNYTWWKRLLWWLPALLMLAYTIKMAIEPNFIPDNPAWIDNYLLLLCLLIVPKAMFSICSVIGLFFCRLRKKRRNWGNLVGLVLSLLLIYIFVYGSTFGIRKLNVKHVEVTFKDLPASFDGYRIVHWSDAHVGSYLKSRRPILERAVDSIRAQQADMVVFTGDLQNLQPSELYPIVGLFKSIKAKDGVYSVLGNHDYSGYIHADAAVKVANERETISRQRQCGWTVLLNENCSIYRGRDSIVIAGGENDGLPPHPARGNIHQTLRGVGDDAFVVMLQHDPSAWRRHILPESKAQLTLSGHTHGGQISVMGFRPSKFKYAEDWGLYHEGDRFLYVTAGLGGLVPFRFGVPAEIVVITLHRQK